MDDIKIFTLALVFYIMCVFCDGFHIRKECNIKSNLFIYVISLHYLVRTFFVFGWLFNNKTVLTMYVIGAIILIIHWVTNGWNCIITEIENIECGKDQKKKYKIAVIDDITWSALNTLLIIVLSIIATNKLFKY